MQLLVHGVKIGLAEMCIWIWVGRSARRASSSWSYGASHCGLRWNRGRVTLWLRLRGLVAVGARALPLHGRINGYWVGLHSWGLSRRSPWAARRLGSEIAADPVVQVLQQ